MKKPPVILHLAAPRKRRHWVKLIAATATILLLLLALVTALSFLWGIGISLGPVYLLVAQGRLWIDYHSAETDILIWPQLLALLVIAIFIYVRSRNPR